MIALSDAQLRVVNAPIGKPLQVLASAGAGKTRVLTERIRHILSSTKKEGVIAITFTNKAAEEMLVRLEEVEDLEERCWVATIHSVAQRIIDQYGHAIGLPSELHIYDREQDRKAVFLQSLRDGNELEDLIGTGDSVSQKDRDKLVQSYMDRFSEIKRELLSEEEIKERFSGDENFCEAFRAYQQGLILSGGMDFDDILVYAHRILLEQPWCGEIYRAKYKHICVDEAQDLNRAQYEFLKALCADEIRSVMMVGDPNQMIYGFTSASQEFLVERFVDDFDPMELELKENYRSSRAVVALANRLKPGSQVGIDYALKGRAQLKSLEDEEKEAKWICDKIEEILALKEHAEIEGEISAKQMVLLARNRFVFQAVEKELKNRNIPYALKRGERKAEPSSVVGKVLDLSIRLRLNPKDWVDGRKLCETLKIPFPRKWGVGNVLDDFAETVRSSEIPFAEIQADLLTGIATIDLEKPNILKLCKDLDRKINALGVQVTTGKSDGEEPQELERSLLELEDFRRSWAIFRRKGLGESLAAFRNASALGQISEDTEIEGLMLSTVHTMKGLERDIVFLMGMCEGVFPDYRAGSKRQLAEELNNVFVAVTRSRRWIYITYPMWRIMPWGDVKAQTPSRFISKMQTKGPDEAACLG